MSSPTDSKSQSEGATKAPSIVQHSPAGTPYLTLPLPLTRTSNTPIFITPFHVADAPGQTAILSQEVVARNLISPPWPFHQSDAEAYINLQLSSPATATNLSVLRAGSPDAESGGLIIGGVSLQLVGKNALGLKEGSEGEQDEVKEEEYMIGYYLDPKWQGKGIVKAAVREVVKWGKEVHGESMVAIVRVEEKNLASRRVVEGMREWVKVEERDENVTWPEVKGGGVKKVLFWRWQD